MSQLPSTALCPGDDLGAQLKIWTAVGLAHTLLFTRIKTDDFSIQVSGSIAFACT